MDSDSLRRALNKNRDQDDSSTSFGAEKSGSEDWPSKWKEIEHPIKDSLENENPQSRWPKGGNSIGIDSGIGISDMGELKLQYKKIYDIPAKNDSILESDQSGVTPAKNETEWESDQSGVIPGKKTGHHEYPTIQIEGEDKSLAKIFKNKPKK